MWGEGESGEEYWEGPCLPDLLFLNQLFFCTDSWAPVSDFIWIKSCEGKLNWIKTSHRIPFCFFLSRCEIVILGTCGCHFNGLPWCHCFKGKMLLNGLKSNHYVHNLCEYSMKWMLSLRSWAVHGPSCPFLMSPADAPLHPGEKTGLHCRVIVPFTRGVKFRHTP